MGHEAHWTDVLARIWRTAWCTVGVILLLVVLALAAQGVYESLHWQQKYRNLLAISAHKVSAYALEFAEQNGHYPRTREEYDELADDSGARLLDTVEGYAERAKCRLDRFEVQSDVEPGASEWVAAPSGPRGRVELWGDGTVAMSERLAPRKDRPEWLRVLVE